MRSNLEHIKIMVTTIGFNGEHTHVAKPERIGLAGHPGDAIENCIKGPQGKFWVRIQTTGRMPSTTRGNCKRSGSFSRPEGGAR